MENITTFFLYGLKSVGFCFIVQQAKKGQCITKCLLKSVKEGHGNILKRLIVSKN